MTFWPTGVEVCPYRLSPVEVVVAPLQEDLETRPYARVA